MTKKNRKESGRIHNKEYDPEEGKYNTTNWDDWNDHRDGFREVNKDNTKKQPKAITKGRWYILEKNFNKKIIRLLKRRKSKKLAQKEKNNQEEQNKW